MLRPYRTAEKRRCMQRLYFYCARCPLQGVPRHCNWGDACVAPTQVIAVGPGWGHATNASAAGVSHQSLGHHDDAAPRAQSRGYYPCRGDACGALIA